MGGEMPFEDRALFGKRQKLSTCLGERHDLDILPHWVALTSGVDDGASRGIEISTCVIEAPFELGGEAALDLVSPTIASGPRQQQLDLSPGRGPIELEPRPLRPGHNPAFYVQAFPA